jgi:hypothetical protein
MTNPNPSPELRETIARQIDLVAFDEDGLATYRQARREAAFRAADRVIAALSQTPPPPSLSTDAQSAATGFHEHDVSLKVAMPGVGEVKATVAETVTVEPLATVAAGDDEGVAALQVLRAAVKNLLPIGNDQLPGDRVIPIYVRMDELRALHSLATSRSQHEGASS